MIKRLHYEVHGEADKPTIVICNGLSQSTANWRGIARQNTHIRWVLFDARGCGRSPIGKRPYSLDDHVADLLWVLEQAQVEKPIVMGFSHGGRVALRAVSQNPDRFRAIILVSANSEVTTQRKAHVTSWHKVLEIGGLRAMAWTTLPNIVGKKILERFSDWELLVNGTVTRNSEEGLLAMFEGMASYPPQEDDARSIQIPGLVMQGGEDPILIRKDYDNFIKWMGDTHGQWFPDCGHTLPLEETGQFIEALEAFIHGLPA